MRATTALISHALMDRTGITEAWRVEGGVVFYLRPSHKRGKLYQVAFIAEETEIPRSSFCAPKVLPLSMDAVNLIFRAIGRCRTSGCP